MGIITLTVSLPPYATRGIRKAWVGMVTDKGVALIWAGHGQEDGLLGMSSKGLWTGMVVPPKPRQCQHYSDTSSSNI